MNAMPLNTFTVFLVCFSAVSLQALNPCPGASGNSQEGFPGKFNTSPIVAYGIVSEVRDTEVAFKVRCTIKGQLTDSIIKFTQPGGSLYQMSDSESM